MNTLRLFGALDVMLGHIVKHLEIKIPLVDMFITLVDGVPLFFIISGYLTWISVSQTDDVVLYAKKRFFRVYPELWVGNILSCIAILLFYQEEIVWSRFGLFFLCQSTVLQFWTPQFLRGYGCGTPNGSLWTMCVIVQFYIAVWLFRKLFRGKTWLFWITAFVSFVVTGSALVNLEKVLPEILYKLYCQTLIPYAWLFLLGMLLADKQEYILVGLKKYWHVSLTFCFLVRFLPWKMVISGYSVLDNIALGLFCIGFAYAFPGLNIKRDISYALYIYHMIVVNVMITVGCKGTMSAIIIACAVSTMLAFLSTRYISNPIQRKAARMKDSAGGSGL